MKLKRLLLNNIRSYSSGEIIFPEGSTLLSGDIGAGKTTILLALEFALFGLQPGQKASGLLATGEDNGEILLELEIDNEPVIIERALRRGAKSISHESAFLTYKGFKEELSVTELKTKILNLLNYPDELIKKTNLLYRYTVYSPQEEMKYIILEDPESRLNVIRHVFGIDKYKKIRENLSIVTSRLREETRNLSAEVRTVEQDKNRVSADKERLLVLKDKIALQEKVIFEKKSKRKIVESEIKEIETKINEKRTFEKEIEKSQVLLSAKMQQHAERLMILEDLERRSLEKSEKFDEKNLKEVIEAIFLARSQRDQLNKQYIELSSRLKSLNSKKEESFEKRKRVFEIQICPTCLQDVSEVHKHNILNEMESYKTQFNKEVEQVTSALAGIEKEQVKLDQQYQEFLNRKSALELLKMKEEESKKSFEQLVSLKKNQETLQKDIAFLNAHMTSLKASVLEFSKYENIYRSKDAELRKLFQEEKQSEIEFAEMRKEEELIRKEVVLLEATILGKEKIRDKISRVMQVESWISGEFLNLVSYTERNILLKLREEFSRLFNQWFSILTTDAFYVQLDETFTPIILQGDYELDYAFLSGGERTAVALAYRLALNQVINSIFSTIKTRDVLILDEPTDGFSDQQLDKVRDILHDLNVKQLILVSHEQKIEGFVDNIIKLKKEEGKTVVVSS